MSPRFTTTWLYDVDPGMTVSFGGAMCQFGTVLEVRHDHLRVGWPKASADPDNHVREPGEFVIVPARHVECVYPTRRDEF